MSDWTKEVLKSTFDLHASQLVGFARNTFMYDPLEEFLTEKSRTDLEDLKIQIAARKRSIKMSKAQIKTTPSNKKSLITKLNKQIEAQKKQIPKLETKLKKLQVDRKSGKKKARKEPRI